jgi:hypothetical protein
MAPADAPLTKVDVSRILTEEARAKEARRIVADRIQPLAAELAELLPNVPRRSPATEAAKMLRNGLRRWAGKQLPDTWSEAEVERFVEELVSLLDQAGEQAGADTDEAAAQSIQRTRQRLGDTVRNQFEARLRPTVSPDTVRKNFRYSYPLKGEPRFARPMPFPNISHDPATRQRKMTSMLWSSDQEPAIRQWYRDLPGRGAGGGAGAHKSRRQNTTSPQ